MDALGFAGGGLDRAAHLRASDDWRAQAQVLPVWRGKVLVGTDGALLRLERSHPALEDADAAVFLGLDAEHPVAAQDISVWAPPNLPETQLFFDPTEQVHPAIPEGRFVELRGIMAQLSPMDGELAATARALTWNTQGSSSPAILYMLGIIRSRPWDAVKVVVRDPACRDPCTAPAAPASDCISETCTGMPKMFVLP